jgi:GcrA cell cycle regulator
MNDGHSFDWNEDNLAALKEMLADGWAGSQIAQRLGITRSAAIGKIHRMGFHLKRKRNGGDNGSLTHVSKKRSPLKSGPRSQNLYNLAGLKCKPLPHPSADPEVMVLCTILELLPGSCRFPIGEPAHPDFRYCGNPKAEDKTPYCPHHMKTTHTSAAQYRARQDNRTGFNYYGTKV